MREPSKEYLQLFNAVTDTTAALHALVESLKALQLAAETLRLKGLNEGLEGNGLYFNTPKIR